ncbi:MAG TPA: HypC/HybG/HupF family hydrogenase formation chaperone [Rectinemataceae bacterium]|nr:HypC/HybG/HupF family hydrogenase formation chaperone [Rectinemataceae bacterium]
MCLAVPLELTEILDSRTAVATSGDVTLEVDVSLLRDPAPGDFVIVHAGYAIEKLDRDEAERTLSLFDELARHGDLAD